MTRSRLVHPAAGSRSLPAVLHALSDETRLEIVRTLDRKGAAVCGDFAHLAAPSTLTHHFRVLREAGLIRTRADGPCNRSTLRRDDLDDRFAGVLDAVLAAGE